MEATTDVLPPLPTQQPFLSLRRGATFRDGGVWGAVAGRHARPRRQPLGVVTDRHIRVALLPPPWREPHFHRACEIHLLKWFY